MNWEAVIGLEIHVQLATVSKLFSGSSTRFGAAPNRQANAIDLGLPGTLPSLNAEALRMAIRFGLAVEAEIAQETEFARKNYFYPDLPKGYQISQLDRPIVGPGRLVITLDGHEKTIGITRAHLEEDAGKSVHDIFPGQTGIDLNRAGTPLLEIVSEPDLRSAAEAVAYMREAHRLVRWLAISDGNMQEGSFRADANVSVRPAGATTLGTRTEIKNLNSFRFVEKAIEFELDRQIEVLQSGGTVIQETRLYDPEQGETRIMRSKEEAQDYRYFPDPDLLPVSLEAALIDELRAELPELPRARYARFIEALGLPAQDAATLTGDRLLADYFERVSSIAGDAKLAANWVTGELLGVLNRDGLTIAKAPVTPEALGALLARLRDGSISSKIAKTVFALMISEGGEPDTLIAERGLQQLSDSDELAGLIAEILAGHPEQIKQFRAGKTKVLGYFVGEIMKRTGGRANPQQVNELLRAQLDSIGPSEAGQNPGR